MGSTPKNRQSSVNGNGSNVQVTGSNAGTASG